ncbi:alpha/beta fold hydrolase [Brevundimonas sp.]|uniref:alpha/beta fold hydrolase n=1 Tax=Brevundimonas sp. TaxID=1871086 RepID=UPI003565A3B3
MSNLIRPCRGVFAPPRLAVILGVLIACAVANDQARAQTATPVASVAAPFVSDRLSVEVVGAGPDVILIPGFGSSREVWRVEAERLKATHRVHLVQLAGFAGEPWSHGDGPFVQPVVDDLARYVREQGLERPAVIGHSLGALIGLRLAQTHPEAVGRLMSVDSLPFFGALRGPDMTVETMAPMAEQTVRSILSLSDDAFRSAQIAGAQGMTRDPALRERLVAWTTKSDRKAMGAAMKDVFLTDARPGLAAMRLPVTVLYAADADGGASAAQADRAWGDQYAPLPGATLIRVDGSRHFIMADQPERFAELVDGFLAHP